MLGNSKYVILSNICRLLYHEPYLVFVAYICLALSNVGVTDSHTSSHVKLSAVPTQTYVES